MQAPHQVRASQLKHCRSLPLPLLPSPRRSRAARASAALTASACSACSLCLARGVAGAGGACADGMLATAAGRAPESVYGRDMYFCRCCSCCARAACDMKGEAAWGVIEGRGPRCMCIQGSGACALCCLTSRMRTITRDEDTLLTIEVVGRRVIPLLVHDFALQGFAAARAHARRRRRTWRRWLRRRAARRLRCHWLQGELRCC